MDGACQPPRKARKDCDGVYQPSIKGYDGVSDIVKKGVDPVPVGV
jgi:hypothetical protein